MKVKSIYNLAYYIVNDRVFTKYNKAEQYMKSLGDGWSDKDILFDEGIKRDHRSQAKAIAFNNIKALSIMIEELEQMYNEAKAIADKQCELANKAEASNEWSESIRAEHYREEATRLSGVFIGIGKSLGKLRDKRYEYEKITRC